MSSAEWSTLLASSRKLDREKGLSALKTLLDSGTLSDDSKLQIEATLWGLLCSESWEGKHGGLMAAGLLLNTCTKQFCDQVKSRIPLLLEEKEPRVRIATGELVGRLCELQGPALYKEVEPTLLAGIQGNIEREGDVSEEHSGLAEKIHSHGSASSSSSVEEVEQKTFPSAAEIFHDTAGWKALETYMLALQHAVVGCGSAFEPFITSDLLQLIFTALGHTNRFVRETGFRVLATIVKCPDLSSSTTSAHWPAVARHLALGLADNWSQVRMSSSVATREFLTHLSPPESKEAYLPVLLPAMCLNRYYVAEGVRLYSQESWRLLTESKGVELVEQHISHVAEFYISQSQAANHAVREAACACIAELGTKVSKDCLRPYVGRLVGVLLDCFKDDSWPVRDAACLACGNFLLCFPEECRSFLEELFPLFLANLEDSIPSVRQGASVAIGNIVKAYGSEVEEKVFAVLQERLPLTAAQPPDDDDPAGGPSLQPARQHPGVDPGPAVFGVVRRVEEHHQLQQPGSSDAAHTDQQMYSCGSLAPKMKRGSAGGCMDSQFHKPAQPWEKSEGCIHLLSELSQQKSCEERVGKLLPVLAEAARHKHYSHHYSFLETLLKQLPVIAKALGKRPFKRYLELFLDPLFYALSCDRMLARAAAEECLRKLTQQIGRMIMRGRIEQHNASFVSMFDQALLSY